MIVFLERLVRRAISLIDRPSRSRILRTFAYIAMVCTSFPYKTSCLVGKVATPWSIFGEQNRVFLVSFQRAATEKTKPNGKTRTIDNPDEILKNLQKRISLQLLRKVPLSECVHGAVPGRSALTNARVHVGQRCVVGLDIANFFPSVSHRAVYETWTRLGFGPDLSSMLTRLTTFRGHLPQGAPTSTDLANHLLSPLDVVIEQLSKAVGVNYTRYVDDITLSGERARELIPAVITALRPYRLTVSRKKLKVAGGGKSRSVTGHTVDRRSGPNVSQTSRDGIRAAIHQLRCSDPRQIEKREKMELSIRGRIAHVRRTNPGAASRLLSQLELALRSSATSVPAGKVEPTNRVRNNRTRR